MTDRELLRIHLEAVWDVATHTGLGRTKPDMVATGASTPWSVYLATLARGRLAIWRPDVVPDERQRLRAQALAAGPVWDEALKMRREVVFSCPRTFSRRRARVAAQLARALTADADASSLEAFEAGSAAYFLDPKRAPCIGVVVDGRLMSIAHSSRRTGAACELGIETVPEARRRGYGAAATIMWTIAVRELRLVPIYSAFAWNTASLHLATSIGYRPCIDGVYGPVTETTAQ